MSNEEFKFSIGVTIEEYTGNEEVVKIPAKINSLPVTKIVKPNGTHT